MRKVNENTNLVKENGTVWRALFNYQGCPVYKVSDECGLTSIQAKGTLTLSHPHLKNGDRCVIVSTILGHKRIAQRQSKPNEYGRFRVLCLQWLHRIRLILSITRN